MCVYIRGAMVTFLNMGDSWSLLDFRSSIVLAMYKIDPISFKTQLAFLVFFWVFKLLNLVQGCIISLQILSLHFLTASRLSKFSDLGWRSCLDLEINFFFSKPSKGLNHNFHNFLQTDSNSYDISQYLRKWSDYWQYC